MPRAVKTYYLFKVIFSRYETAARREEVSDFLGAYASTHRCLGILDWSVAISNDEKILAVEREFMDLSARAGEAHPIELWFPTRARALAMRTQFKKFYPQIKVSEVYQEVKRDWMRLWRKHYRPIQIVQNGETLWIVPSWMKFPARSKNHIVLKIHPGQAFGTGTHPTTELCLRALFEFFPRTMDPKEKHNFLDFGAGTGILGIGALQWSKRKKISAKLTAVEIDPDAREILEKNRKVNRLVFADRKSLPKSGSFRLIFANVLAPVLLAHRDSLLKLLAPGGILILSGILKEEALAFQSDFMKNAPANMRRLHMLTKEDWAAIVIGKDRFPKGPPER